MIKRILPAILLLGTTSLSACHTDPFSMKPDVRGVRLPEKPAPAPADDAPPADEPEQR